MNAPNSGTRLIGSAGSDYLDVLRGLAANIVVIGHLNNIHELGLGRFQYGQLGVAIFFLLSGYLITSTALSSDGDAPMARFLANRAARILTPYLPALILIVAVETFFISRYWGIGGENRGVVAFLANVFLLQDYPVLQAIHNVFPSVPVIRTYNTAEPFWTVAIEFWIYVFFAIMFFCIGRGERVRLKVVIPLFLVSLPIVVWNAFAGGGGSLSLIWFLGAAFSVLHMSIRKSSFKQVAIGLVLLGTGCLGIAAITVKRGFYPYDLQTSVFLAFVIFGTLFVINNRKSVGFISLVAFGISSYSYSLYLLHNTIIVFFKEQYPVSAEGKLLLAALTFIAAQIVSVAFYYCFERHYRTVAIFLRPRLQKLLY